MSTRTITLTVNDQTLTREVPVRKTLADFLREDLGLTGTHVGCELGQCGACTVLLNGDPVKSCLLFAVQAEGSQIVTVEGLAGKDALHPLQQAFHDHHALQCGFCTPGMLLAAVDLLSRNPAPKADEIRRHLSGNLCRCTGYVNIVKAIEAVGAGAAGTDTVSTGAVGAGNIQK
ncbi:MAG: (2Fe-2S)-binding protein [Firmicutes bacterium]|nr:(2Fe-2S)-binding protein [Bacillota bacterium]